MLLAALLAAALAAAPDSVRPTPDGAEWTPVLAYDEVTAEVDAAHLGGAGVVSAWVRWTFADRAVSPAAWDAGVRATLDAVEVDCRAGAMRTVASDAYAADGARVDAAAVADDGAAWQRHRPGSLGAGVVAGVCRLAARQP